MEKQEALAALDTAIQMELEGHNFYVKTADQVSWPEGRSMLLDLAKDEMEHIRILKEQHLALVGGHDWLSAEKIAPEMASGQRKPLPVFEKRDAVVAGMVTDRADAMEVLDVAIRNEYKSHSFYSEQLEKAENPEAKMIFSWLVREEKSHQEILTEYAKYIGAHHEWLLEHEKPLMEG